MRPVAWALRQGGAHSWADRPSPHLILGRHVPGKVGQCLEQEEGLGHLHPQGTPGSSEHLPRPAADNGCQPPLREGPALGCSPHLLGLPSLLRVGDDLALQGCADGSRVSV